MELMWVESEVNMFCWLCGSMGVKYFSKSVGLMVFRVNCFVIVLVLIVLSVFLGLMFLIVRVFVVLKIRLRFWIFDVMC